YVDAEDRLSQGETQEEKPEVSKLSTLTPPPGLPLDPASIAKQNLLDRIRATRATVAGMTTAKAGDKK
ncbi:MAG: hypothetical protein ACKODX_17665, partial [Gemmata sp.]